jgi:hypothetical protein
MRTGIVASALLVSTACGGRPVVILDQTYVAPDKLATTYSLPYARKSQGDIFVRVCDISPDGGTRNCKDTKVLGAVGIRNIDEGQAR